MTLSVPLLLLVPLMAAGPGDNGTITLRDARALTRDQLEHRFLARSDRGMREVLVHDGTGPNPYDGRLTEIIFGEAPKASRFPGLCQVRTISIPFEAPKGTSGADAPVRAGRQVVLRRYAVVTDPLDRRPNEAACRAAAPVLETSRWDRRTRFFGTYAGARARDLGPDQVSFIVRAFHASRKRAPKGLTLGCRPDSFVRNDSLCVDPVASLAALRWDRLESIAFGSCFEKPGKSCATLHFLRSDVNQPGADHAHVYLAFENSPSESPRAVVRTIEIVGLTYVD